MGSPPREATLSFSFLSSISLGVNSLRKEFAPMSKFFPLRVDPIMKRLHCPGKQTGSHKSCFPLQNWWKKMEVYPHT